MTDNDNTTNHRPGDPYRQQLEMIEALPCGPDREKMLRLLLADAWTEGWETAYNEGGIDSNPYMTGREIRTRNEQIKADHDAYVMAKITGSRGATAHRSWTDAEGAAEVTGNYARCGEWIMPENTVCGRTVEHGECPVHGEVGP